MAKLEGVGGGSIENNFHTIITNAKKKISEFFNTIPKNQIQNVVEDGRNFKIINKYLIGMDDYNENGDFGGWTITFMNQENNLKIVLFRINCSEKKFWKDVWTEKKTKGRLKAWQKRKLPTLDYFDIESKEITEENFFQGLEEKFEEIKNAKKED